MIALIAHLFALAIIWSAGCLVMVVTAPLWLPLACHCDTHWNLLNGCQRAAGIMSAGRN